MEHRLEQQDRGPFRCSVAPGKFRWHGTTENVVFHLELLSDGIFRNLFVNGKQREPQLIHVQLVLAYSCPHLFCILKKSGKLKLLHQHFETAYGVNS